MLMESESEKKMNELLALTRENNKMLHGMRRAVWWGRLFWIVKWVLILGLAYYGFMTLQPYLNAVVQAYNTMIEGVNKVKEVGDKIPTIGADLFLKK